MASAHASGGGGVNQVGLGQSSVQGSQGGALAALGPTRVGGRFYRDTAALLQYEDSKSTELPTQTFTVNYQTVLQSGGTNYMVGEGYFNYIVERQGRDLSYVTVKGNSICSGTMSPDAFNSLLKTYLKRSVGGDVVRDGIPIDFTALGYMLGKLASLTLSEMSAMGVADVGFFQAGDVGAYNRIYVDFSFASDDELMWALRRVLFMCNVLKFTIIGTEANIHYTVPHGKRKYVALIRLLGQLVANSGEATSGAVLNMFCKGLLNRFSVMGHTGEGGAFRTIHRYGTVVRPTGVLQLLAQNAASVPMEKNISIGAASRYIYACLVGYAVICSACAPRDSYGSVLTVVGSGKVINSWAAIEQCGTLLTTLLADIQDAVSTLNGVSKGLANTTAVSALLALPSEPHLARVGVAYFGFLVDPGPFWPMLSPAMVPPTYEANYGGFNREGSLPFWDGRLLNRVKGDLVGMDNMSPILMTTKAGTRRGAHGVSYLICSRHSSLNGDAAMNFVPGVAGSVPHSGASPRVDLSKWNRSDNTMPFMNEWFDAHTTLALVYTGKRRFPAADTPVKFHWSSGMIGVAGVHHGNAGKGRQPRALTARMLRRLYARSESIIDVWFTDEQFNFEQDNDGTLCRAWGPSIESGGSSGTMYDPGEMDDEPPPGPTYSEGAQSDVAMPTPPVLQVWPRDDKQLTNQQRHSAIVSEMAERNNAREDSIAAKRAQQMLDGQKGYAEREAKRVKQLNVSNAHIAALTSAMHRLQQALSHTIATSGSSSRSDVAANIRDMSEQLNSQRNEMAAAVAQHAQLILEGQVEPTTLAPPELRLPTSDAHGDGLGVDSGGLPRPTNTLAPTRHPLPLTPAVDITATDASRPPEAPDPGGRSVRVYGSLPLDVQALQRHVDEFVALEDMERDDEDDGGTI